MKKKSEVTNQEILQAINSFSTHVEKRFDGVDARLDGVETRLDGVETRLDGVDARLGGLETRLDGVDARLGGLENEVKTIKNTMVTKIYLDEKLMDLRGDMVIMMRQEDKKVDGLISVLEKKKVLSSTEAKQIISLKPFN